MWRWVALALCVACVAFALPVDAQAQTPVAFALTAVVALQRTTRFDRERRVWFKTDEPVVVCEGVSCPKAAVVPYNTSRVMFFGQWFPSTTELSSDGFMTQALLSRGFTFLPMAGAWAPNSLTRVLVMAFPAESALQPLDVTAEVNVVLAATNARLPFAMNKTRPENRVHAIAYDYTLAPTPVVGDLLGYQPIAGFPNFYDPERFYDPVGDWWVWRLPNLLRSSICIAVLSNNYYATRTSVSFPWLADAMLTENPADDRKTTTNPASDPIMSCTSYASSSSEATVTIVTTSLQAGDVSPLVTTRVRLRPVVYRELRHIEATPSHGRVAFSPPFNMSHYEYVVYFSSLHSRRILVRVLDHVKSTLAVRVVMGNTTVLRALQYNTAVNFTLPAWVLNANGTQVSVAMSDALTSSAAEIWHGATAVYRFTFVYSNESSVFELPLRLRNDTLPASVPEDDDGDKEWLGWEWQKWMYVGIAAASVIVVFVAFVAWRLRWCDCNSSEPHMRTESAVLESFD